ncbi:enkurin-like [Liolophura sinensis]|uniref:enkurin-like n=1 Tax=Liolophura sinensis TaxID=3198878 RepID=UPI00315855C5
MYSDESIYDLIPREELKKPKEARYTSKFRDNVKVEKEKNKDSYKTMGPAKVLVPETTNFLRKHTKEPVLPDKQPFKYPDEDHRRPAVPAPSDRPLMGLKTTKNFITTNAVENITSVPKKAEKIYVDTKKGDKHKLDTSGLEPIYIKKKDFGETPQYLLKRREEIRKAQEEYDAYIAEHFRRGTMKQLTREEREHILMGLKANWEEIHKEYQGLSVVTDTAPKKNRKERMEAEMKQLERDIQIIEKHTQIYIGN